MEEQDQQSEQAVEAVEQQTDAQVADNVGETAAAESSVENAATANSDKNDKGKKGHGLVLVLVTVLVLVLAAGCVAAVVLLQGSGDKKDDSQRADNKYIRAHRVYRRCDLLYPGKRVCLQEYPHRTAFMQLRGIAGCLFPNGHIQSLDQGLHPCHR